LELRLWIVDRVTLTPLTLSGIVVWVSDMVNEGWEMVIESRVASGKISVLKELYMHNEEV
jgi:hypothetical protein